MEKQKEIDIEQLIRRKSPRLYFWMPGFVIRFLKRKIHQDFINAGLRQYDNVYGHDFNEAALHYMGARVEFSGEENIPGHGGFILAANHPLGGLDGLALIKAVSSKRKDVRFIVNDILKNLKNFGDLFVGVNKLGSTGTSALKTVEQVYASDAAVLVFPAGLVSRKVGDRIMDLEWKKSFINKAIKYQKPVLPVYVSGRNSMFFYRLANLRKFLGIKVNIEMMFLPDEMVKQKGKTIRIKFGKIISPETFDQSLNHHEWAQMVKHYVYYFGHGGEMPFEEFAKKQKHSKA